MDRLLTTRRVLVSEWVEGPRLADCSPAVVRELVPIGVECFLCQLLDIGAFHSDPHPGNLLVIAIIIIIIIIVVFVLLLLLLLIVLIIMWVRVGSLGDGVGEGQA